MVVIRLNRQGGRKKCPHYKITVIDRRRAAQSGADIETIGYFNPQANATNHAVRLKLESERLEYWRSQGAQPSKRVLSLIKELKHKSN